MFKNHLKIAIRNLWNNRFFSLLNLSGLAIGLAVSLALMLFVKEELSFDRFHENADHLYRAGIDVTYDDTNEKWAQVPNIAGPAFTDDIAEMQSFVRIFRHSFGKTSFLTVGDQNFIEENLYWVDSTIFELFDIPLIQGDPTTALHGPNKVVLSQKAARKLFGNLDPMGQLIKQDNVRELLVTGVYEDFPDNSRMDADMMGSFSTQKWASDNLYWSNCSFETYFLLHPDAEISTVENKMADVLNKAVKPEEQWFAFWLQPLTDVHLYSGGIRESYTTKLGDIRQVQLLSALALAVLLLACFNYINMTTARSQQRFREVGINKTLGATSAQMVRRFYVETGILVAMSLMVGTLLVEVSLPLFESISGKEMSVLDLVGTKWIWALPVVWASVTFGAGLYPALFLSSFTPKKLLSPLQAGGGQSKFFRKTLVVTQFAVCIALIMGALVFQRQLEYISNKKLGFEPEQVVAVTTSGIDTKEELTAFNNAARTLPNVQKIVRSQAFPGIGTSGYSVSKPGNDEQVTSVASCWAEPGFEEVLGLEIIAGRTLPEKTKEDTTVQVVINEKLVEFLGFATPEDAIGKGISDLYYERPTDIVGVVKDFHHESLHQPIMPYVFTNGNGLGYKPFSLVKLSTSNLKESMNDLEKTFKEHVPSSAFEYTFVDEQLDRLYNGEKRLSRVVLIFTLLTIFISCLGLFGLAAFTAERRTKEIGIRKVLGASVAGLVGLLAKDFLKPVLLAILIAAPVAWYGMNEWLTDFAYRINIEWWYLAVAGILAIAVAFFTVSVQSLKAALANPVKSLRSE